MNNAERKARGKDIVNTLAAEKITYGDAYYILTMARDELLNKMEADISKKPVATERTLKE